MQNTISATQAKMKFGEILGAVSFGKEHVTIEKQKQPLAVMIPIDDYEDYVRLKNSEKKWSRQELFNRVERFRKSLPPSPAGAPTGVEIIRELRESR